MNILLCRFRIKPFRFIVYETSFFFPGNEYLELFQICNFKRFETNIYSMNIPLSPVSESSGSLFIRQVFSSLFPGNEYLELFQIYNFETNFYYT